MDNFKRSLLQLVTRYPFFARLSIGRVEESYEIPTAATDGRRILYNPDFVSGLTKEESLGLLVHEVLHIAHKHGLNPILCGTRFCLEVQPVEPQVFGGS